MEKHGRTADDEVDSQLEQQSVVRPGSAADAKTRKEKSEFGRKGQRQTEPTEDDATYDEIEAARLNQKTQVTIRLPRYLEQQVLLVKDRRRYKRKSDAFVYVLNRGLETITRELNQPDRIEDMVVRTEHMSIDTLALVRLLVSHLAPDIDVPDLQIERAHLIEELHGRTTE